MRVAVVHYHYRPGGVTRVVENAFAALQGRGIAMVAISGEPYPGGDLPVRMQPGLGYSQANEKLSPGPLWYSLKTTARRAFGGEPDVWHFHNHALGKNSAMAEVVDKMALDAPVLLQCHDFAEDGRPANYAMLRARTANLGCLYPQGAQVHYAATNARDAAFMRQAGFRAENIHLLPNPVNVADAVAEGSGGAASPAASSIGGSPIYRSGAGSDGPSSGASGSGQAGGSGIGHAAGLPLASRADTQAHAASASGVFSFLQAGQQLYLYPTRAIRRKNIGEFLLWAALAGNAQDAVYALTLAPANPAEQPEYRRWVAFAAEMKLPVAFGVGQGRNAPAFANLMRRAKAVVTTSVAEGFGLAFLEPYLFNRPVLGRNLPDITADFAAHGVNFDSLYERLLVPEALLSIPLLRQKIVTGLQRSYEAYGRTVPAGAADICFESMRDGQGRVDFGRLDEELQRQVIANLMASPHLKEGIAPATLVPAAMRGGASGASPVPGGDLFSDAFAGDAPMGDRLAGHGSMDGGMPACDTALAAMVARNRDVVQRNYGLAAYGDRLAALYEKVADSRRESLSYLQAGCLLDSFLAPERFSLLRA